MERLRGTGEGLFYRKWSGKSSLRSKILNVVKGNPCRHLKRKHPRRGSKCEDHERGARLVCSRKCEKAAGASGAGPLGARVVGGARQVANSQVRADLVSHGKDLRLCEGEIIGGF